MGSEMCIRDRVYAVDVGHDQLAPTLRADPRVLCWEGTDIRNVNLAQLGKPADFFSVDVSFISLEYVLPAAAALLASGGMAVVLIKPQFEAGKENIGKNGLVLSKKVHETVLYRMLGLFRTLGLSLQMLCPSPIQGGSGNIEYLAAVQKSDAPPCSMDLREVIEQAFSAKRGKKEKAK